MPLLLAIDLDGFESGSPTHFAALLGCLIAAAAACRLGRRLPPQSEHRLRRGWGWFTVVTQVVATLWWLWPSNFDWSISLPLHVCDLVAAVAALAMLTNWRWTWSMVYFWGIGLCIFAFIIPSLKHGPAHVEFYLFWLTHLQILGTATYLVAVTGFRPTWRDWIIAEILLTLYCIIMIPLDGAMNWNYGFVGPVESPSSALGPWPARIPIMYAIQLMVLGSLLAPWLLVKCRQETA